VCQGYKSLRERSWQSLLGDISTLDAAVEEDAQFCARRELGKHESPQPLYDRAKAGRCLELFEPVELDQYLSIGSITLYLLAAGYILGAGELIVEAEGKRVGFSGDVDHWDDVLMSPPESLPDLELLLLGFTCGTCRNAQKGPLDELATIVNDAADKGGTLLIPSLPWRAQVLWHPLTTPDGAGRIRDMLVDVDRPCGGRVLSAGDQPRGGGAGHVRQLGPGGGERVAAQTHAAGGHSRLAGPPPPIRPHGSDGMMRVRKPSAGVSVGCGARILDLMRLRAALDV